MTSYRQLRLLFQGLTSLSLAVTAAACSGANDADSIDRSAFTLNVCTSPAAMRGVTPGVAVDYLELRTKPSERMPSPPTNAPFETVESRGVACKTATSASACASALAALNPASGLFNEQIYDNEYFVYTRGDEVGAIATHAQLEAFLAPVTTLANAGYLAATSGFRVECDRTNARATSDGFEVLGLTGGTCGAGTHLDLNVVHVSRDGKTQVTQSALLQEGDPNCAIGRRPAGFVASAGNALSALGAYFGTASELEAASVYAFEQLARDLEGLGAPSSLVHAARDAADDEVRHARVTRKLADRFGASPKPVHVEGTPARALFDIALENATEGCVRETFGALQATYQAQRAADESVARAMRVIAEDETRHAALAWDVAAWLAPRLTDDERARIDAARADAVAELEGRVATPIDPSVARTAGVPDARASAWLFQRVREAIWS